jgi:ATP-binding cassette subfamily E protein 1
MRLNIVPFWFYCSIIRTPTLLISFQVAETATETKEEMQSYARYKYPNMKKSQGSFTLNVEEGEFTDSQIVVMLGENGTGKTTFIRMLVCAPVVLSGL